MIVTQRLEPQVVKFARVPGKSQIRLCVGGNERRRKKKNIVRIEPTRGRPHNRSRGFRKRTEPEPSSPENKMIIKQEKLKTLRYIQHVFYI